MDQSKKYFTTFQVVKILNIKQPTLRDWIERGYIIPSRTEKVARGTKSYFDLWGLYMIKTFEVALKFGLARKEVANLIQRVNSTPGVKDRIKEALKRNQSRKPRGLRYVVTLSFDVKDGEIGLASISSMGGGSILNKDSDFALILNIQKIIAMVDERLRETGL